MLWPKWVVLITGSTGSALRAVGPFQPLHHTAAGVISYSFVLPSQGHRFPIALTLGHHRPGHARNLVGECDRGDFRRPPFE